LKSSLSAWVKPRNIFDVPALEAKIQDLEQLAAQPDFWDDQAKAQEVLQELSDYKASLAQLREWQTNLEDTDAILELLQADNDQALFEEAQGTVAKLSHELDQWELQQLLSGPYDKKGAVLAINAGAGGTDAQDWAEMLLRMYTRWAEQNGFKAHLVELSEGEEAGLKSATLEITGRYAFGYLKAEKGTHRLVQNFAL
jgi:peptide chain release factor 2